MVDLFADVPEETIEDTLQTIRKNLDRVGLYGGHTLYRHADIQLLEAYEGGYSLCHILLGPGSGGCRGQGDHAEIF